MNIFVKICIALGVALAAGLLLFLIRRIYIDLGNRSLLEQLPRQPKLIYQLLRSDTSKRRILRGLRIPCSDAPDAPCLQVGIAEVNTGGVLLIDILNLHGQVENPFKGDWRQFSRKGTLLLKNPIERGEACRRAVIGLLHRNGLSNIPVRHIVVYLDGSTRFKNNMPGIVLADRFVLYHREMRKERVLSASEKRRIMTVLMQNHRPAHPHPKEMEK